MPCQPDHLRGEDLDVQSYVVIELAPKAVFKDQSEARRLSANSSTRKIYIINYSLKGVGRQCIMMRMC